MEDEHELSGIKVLRLFPLSGVVFFPHSVLPLHIFEPRYREMTEDALDGDRLVTIVMVRPDAEDSTGESPEIEEFGCVGRIFKHERLPDGRFNILLVGLKRVRLGREVASQKAYRVAEGEIIDENEVAADARLETALVDDFRQYLEPIGGVEPELEAILSADLPLWVLVDILAHSLHMELTFKQELLAERDVIVRAEKIHSWLEAQIRAQRSPGPEPRGFPPPFSSN